MKLVTQFNNNAEFAQIGDVTISTKSGGDQFHGSAFGILEFRPHKAFNTVPGPSRMLSKTFHLTERMRLRFKSTFTNLFNHPNFATPPTNVTSSSLGIVQSVQTAENSGN